MDRWNLGGAGYLDTLGQQLDLAIDVIWTGPEIISREIPVESIQRLSDRIGRKPLIWDNLHANDYDGRRAFVGPYSGRPLELKNHVAGILSNPQNEFPLNFIPLHTLAQYVAASHGYSPRDAYLAAAGDWLPRFTGPRSSLAFDDLLLLGDCFYLPHEEGEAAREAFALIRNLLDQTVSEWGDRERQFLELKKRIVGIFETLTELYDRELFYAWSRRIWDLREELDLFGSVFANKRQGKELATVETHHPGTYLGGIVAKLQTLLQMDSLGRFSTRDQ
jgi:protein O-GlcNAcase/histone acetyltransferase